MSAENHRKENASKAQAGSSKRNLRKGADGVVVDTAVEENTSLPGGQRLIHYPRIERLVADYNIQEAARKVKSNRGASGIDGVTTDDIELIMQIWWPDVKESILNGTYYPEPVRRIEIPKPDGKGKRKLGIPTVLDRIIQQAVLQEISLAFELNFSMHSYGFRPGRNAHQAVKAAQGYILEGYEWVVDIDLESFFDRVNHDMLMARVARRIKDKKILLLIRRFLTAGIMENGVVYANEEGTPQGGPLSPLLSNIMLDDFDKELEQRGHRFCRYADDCNIYVKSEKAGHRVMESVVRFLTRILKLKVNTEKSAVDKPENRKFLGFSFTRGKEPHRIKIHQSRIERFKIKIKGLVRRMRGNKIREMLKGTLMPILRGWVNYFGLAEARSVFNELDGWIRRKLRCTIWRQWKKPKKRISALMQLGISRSEAAGVSYSSRGPWRISKTKPMQRGLSNLALESMGFIPMMKLLKPLALVS